MRRWISITTLRTQVVALTVLVSMIAIVIVLGALSFASGRSFWTHLPKAILCVPAAAAVAFVFATILSGRLLAPIDQLHHSISAVAAGRVEIGIEPSERAPRDIRELTETFGEMIQRMQRAQDEYEDGKRNVAERGRTVERLLEFAQTIGGAGKPQQIYTSLCQFLRAELSLPYAAVLTYDDDAIPMLQAQATWPENLVSDESNVCDMDVSLCPCLRQNQARTFCHEAGAVRCAIEQCLKLPTDRPAFCVPFHVGRKLQVAVHMILPAGEEWTEERRQLAQTYVNTAQSALTSLHLLSEAEKQSMTDVLTGLYNRRSLEQLLEREVALAERHARPLSIVMIDMDYFKQINDAHGHAAGDYLLKAFADCVRITVRKTDLAFRYGGDEFVIALPQTPIAQAKQVVQKVRQAFSTVDFSSAIAHLEKQPTLSIGVAERSAAYNVLTLQSLLNAADQALYDAKSANRNCVRIYEPPKAA